MVAHWNQTWMRATATVFGWQRWMNNDRFLSWNAGPDLAQATWEWPPRHKNAKERVAEAWLRANPGARLLVSSRLS